MATTTPEELKEGGGDIRELAADTKINLFTVMERETWRVGNITRLITFIRFDFPDEERQRVAHAAMKQFIEELPEKTVTDHLPLLAQKAIENALTAAQLPLTR